MRLTLATLLLGLGSTLCVGAGAGPAAAGAWPREAGTGFVTVAARLFWPQDITTWTSWAPTHDYQTVYFEYGLTDRLTLGLDLGRSVSGAGKTVLFAGMPLRDADTGPKVSTQLGLGQISGETVLRPGLSLGWGWEGGWLSFDAAAEVALATGNTDVKLDATWGRTLARDRMLIVQLQTGLQQGDPGFARLAPSVVLPVSERLKVELGATWGLTGDTDMGLKLGLWTRF